MNHCGKGTACSFWTVKGIFSLVLILAVSGCSEGESDSSVAPAKDIPHINITTENEMFIDLYYTPGEITITDGGETSFSGTMGIKLRGNSSLDYPKKAYHIKLTESSEILGLAKNKDWVLLANYMDETLLTNAIAMKVANLLEMPFSNHIIPVDVSVNGVYQGSYNLTEQIETGGNRVDIEPGGQLLELDQYFNDWWQFRTTQFDLPVMVKYPKVTTSEELGPIQTQFEALTALISDPEFPNNGYLDHIDQQSIVNFFIVMLLTDNEELNHPKSIFIYKPAGGKYNLGPVWDFDWGFGYQKDYVHFVSYTSPLFWTPIEDHSGGVFFSRLLKDPQTKAKLIQDWTSFKANKLPLLLEYVDEYAKSIASSYEKDYTLWKDQQSARPAKINITGIKDWLTNRADFIDTYLTDLN